MKHGKFQKQVKEQLESRAAFVISVSGHRMQISGLPDLLIIHRRWKGWIEIKVEKDPTRTLQRIQAAKIELRGMPIYVLRCVENYKDVSKSWKAYCYTLENFEGKVIEKFDDLRSLLDVLVELENERR